MPAVASPATTPSTAPRRPFPGAATPAGPLANMLTGSGQAATAYAHATNQPPPMVNALAPWSATATPAVAPRGTPTPGLQPQPAGLPGGAPDPHAQFAAALQNAPTAGLVKLAGVQDHVMHAIGTLLDQRTITPASVNAAAKRAVDDGHAEDQHVQLMLRQLPLNDTPQALRSALEAKMGEASQILLAVHGEAQSRGVDLAATLNSKGAQSALPRGGAANG